MSGSRKGRKLRPYRTEKPTGGLVHVLLYTKEDAESDKWEHGPTTRELLEQVIE